MENLAAITSWRERLFFKRQEKLSLEEPRVCQAPLKILDVVESGFSKGRSSYLSMEAQAFGELCSSDQSQNLQHLFFLNDIVKKFPGRGEGKETQLKKLERGAVIGAGVMGAGVCWLMAKIECTLISSI